MSDINYATSPLYCPQCGKQHLYRNEDTVRKLSNHTSTAFFLCINCDHACVMSNPFFGVNYDDLEVLKDTHLKRMRPCTDRIQ